VANRLLTPMLLCRRIIGLLGCLLLAGAANAGDGLYRFDAGLALGAADQLPPWWATVERNAQQQLAFDNCLADEVPDASAHYVGCCCAG